ncbi:MAG TPA: phospho-N-acetylmuramoyl-pentapeptide-transferase [Candidatus Hydrogenedentes bacterium]|nr:phospho-N-acetylmuramoyl-pentapeptide-transferase [Candidatus Hydrogenedentota bacterium]
MLHYLAVHLMPQVGALNVLTYVTVRAGGATLTGFVFCLLAGPRLIGQLRALKVGQYIKKEHVADLHALHKGKAGTPTMGGTLIVLSTVLSLLLWGRLTNRLLWVMMGVLVMMGAVGFLDDYIKLRRKHNTGLSARAKMAGQLLTGLLLGVYLVLNPVTTGPAYVKHHEVTNWPRLVSVLREAGSSDETSSARQFWIRLEPGLQEELMAQQPGRLVHPAIEERLLENLREVLRDPGLYEAELWRGTSINGEVQSLLDRGVETLGPREVARLNRMLLEAAMPDCIVRSPRHLHTQVGAPGFKDLFIPLGPFYILFVVFIIAATSNAVNLTDGLDGLAAGASIISLLAYTGIAYVVSRADWSEYLYVIYVPEASELTVFGAAVLGTGLGFLWFNAHPAEVFMGDTGSLALGGAIGAMALLTKQELLLPLVAGLFVLEAMSVVIQVGSFRLTGRRVFRMAPLHHHFELLGWNETKVTIRFWIIAILFALMSLATLKLR